jgi:TPR repeat protein
MSKVMIHAKWRDQADLDRKFAEANSQWEAGKLRSAFRLFLVAAKAGDQGAQLNLGNFYSDGIGVKPNRAKALYWYRRAYQQGSGSAASNIGILFRDEKRFNRALAWFERAVNLRDGDANVEIAKIHICRNERAKAIRYLKRALRAKRDDITEGSREESHHLLEQLEA